MSFSSLLEEANSTLASTAQGNDTNWSPLSNSVPEVKQEPGYAPQVKHEPGFVPQTEFAHGAVYDRKNFLSYEVRSEPNPFYASLQAGGHAIPGQPQQQLQHPQQLQQQQQLHQMFQQRTHVPIQYDEYYNANSLPKEEFIMNRNIQNNFQLFQNNNNMNNNQPHTKNILPQNIKTETSRKRSNKKSEPRKKVKIEFTGPPPNWRVIYDHLMEMRKGIVAPVDVMGCFKNAEADRGPKVYRYQVMISLMLSSQTKDEVTAGAMTRLKKFGLTPKFISETDEAVIARLIHPVGFWQKKATYIKNASRIVHNEYEDDIPNTVEGLTSLPGIGPKMAHLCMEFAWNKLTGISVDTHVHRICQRLGWTPTGLKQPDDTRKLLEHWLPKEEWGRINLMMVGFGQVVCLPTKPRCFECKVQDLCPYAIGNPERTFKKDVAVKPSARNQKFLAMKAEPKTEPKEEKFSVKPEPGTNNIQGGVTVKMEPDYTYHNPYNQPNSSQSSGLVTHSMSPAGGFVPSALQPHDPMSPQSTLPPHLKLNQGVSTQAMPTQNVPVSHSPQQLQPVQHLTSLPTQRHPQHLQLYPQHFITQNSPHHSPMGQSPMSPLSHSPQPQLYHPPPNHPPQFYDFPNIKQERVEAPPQTRPYHTLTPISSPHPSVTLGQLSVQSPASMSSPLSSLQSPIVDQNSPLINPMGGIGDQGNDNNDTSFNQLCPRAVPTNIKEESLLDVFLDW